MVETFDPPYYLRRSIEVNYSPFSAEWNITGNRCLLEYMDTHDFSINRVDPFQKIKAPCDRCGKPGYDYIVKEKRKA